MHTQSEIRVIDNKFAETHGDGCEKELSKLKFFVRVAAHLLLDRSPERIVERTKDLIEPHLRSRLSELKLSQILDWTRDEEPNRKACNRLCLTLIKPILSKDGYKIVSVDTTQFDHSELNGYAETKRLPKPMGLAEGAAFVAKNNDGHKLLFCFYDKQKEGLFKRISNRALEKDKNKFQTIWFLIFPTHEGMIKYRQVDMVESWPRGFFLCIGELTEKAIELQKDIFGHLEPLCLRSKADYRSQEKIKHFRAEVTRNKPVSAKKDCKHFKIRFKAPELKYVVPGQFVMLDTLPVEKRLRLEESPLSTTKQRHDYTNVLDLKPTSFLKRPFSIHRAFYKYFKFGYLKNMSLPPTLAAISHTHFPEEFEIFYKVLENGIGTNELKEVKEGDRILMLGPLGQFPTLRKWRGNGIEEVHLVGGGVGMAPLVFFGQALRFYSFRLKAFIGIDRIETLLYSAPFAPTFAENQQNAYVYIETLSGIGLRREDIRLSCEILNDTERKKGGLPEKNYHEGTVTEQYKSYLESLSEIDKILVIACGPEPMLQALARIASRFNLPLKVLLEKRMACGIGVCLSCVCRTRKNGTRQYSRVCTDGPLFDSREIDWQ
jgi:dihydroorotate dehydrogenase electron transfer subunit